MKADTWYGYAILHQGALVLFDARCPVYWKRKIAKAAASEHGLDTFEIVKVKIQCQPRTPPRRKGQ